MIRKWTKRIFKSLAIIILILLVLLVVLHIRWTQSALTHYATKYLHHKWGTQVSIGHIRFTLPYRFEINDIYLADQHQDTLLYAKQLLVYLDIKSLFNKQVCINTVQLKAARVHLYRDSTAKVFNYDYILPVSSPEAAGSVSKPLRLKELLLENVHFDYRDDIAGTSVSIQSGHFSATLSDADLFKYKLHFTTSNWENTSVLIKSYRAATSASFNKTVGPEDTLDIIPGRIHVQNSHVEFRDEVTHSGTNVLIGAAKVNADVFSLDQARISADSLWADNVQVQVRLDEQSAAITTQDDPGWKINIAHGQISNSRYKMDDPLSTPVLRGMDYRHPDLRQVQILMDNFIWSDTLSAADIHHLSFKDKSGFQLDSLQTDLAYLSTTGIKFSHLLLKTPQTYLYGTSHGVNTAIRHSYLSMHDLLLLFPVLENYRIIQQYRRTGLSVSANLENRQGHFYFTSCNLTGLHGSLINMHGDIQGLSNADNIRYQLHITDARIPEKDLALLLPAASLKQLRLPAYVRINGSFSGSVNEMRTNCTALTNKGNMTLSGSLKFQDLNAISYNVSANTTALQLGYFLKKDSLIGAITGTLHAAGSGFSLEKTNSIIEGSFKEAIVNNYAYQDIQLHTNIHHGTLHGEWQINDPNLKVQGNAILQADNRLTIRMNADSVSPAALHIYKDITGVKGKLEMEMKNVKMARPPGYFSLNDLTVTMDTSNFHLDNISGHTALQGNQRSTRFQSDFAAITVNGKDDHLKTAKHFLTQLQAYVHDSITTVKAAPFTLKAVIREHPLLTKLFPEYTLSDSLQVSLVYDSSTVTPLQGSILASRISAGALKMDSVKVWLNGTADQLQFTGEARQVMFGQQPLYQVNAQLKAGHNQAALILDNKQPGQQQPWFQIGLTASAEKGRYRFHLTPNKLITNYLPLTINEDHAIWYSPKGLQVNHLQLSSDTASVYINSAIPQGNAPLQITISQLQLATLMKHLSQDTVLEGTINGQTIIDGLQDSIIHYKGNIAIKDIRLRQQPVGDLQLTVAAGEAHQLDIKGALTGNGTNINVKGTYSLNNATHPLQLDGSLDPLPMRLLETFSNGMLDSTSGQLTGKIAVNGTLMQPLVQGKLDFDKVAFRIPASNMHYHIEQQTLTFEDQQASFHDFELRDPRNKTLYLSGTAGFQNGLLQPQLNLHVKADDFQLLNAPAINNPLVFGTAYVNTALKITGNARKPVIKGDIRLNKDSRITYVNRKDTQLEDETKRLVTFRDLRDPVEKTRILAALRQTLPPDSLQQETAGGSSYFSEIDMNITTDSTAAVTIVLDEIYGDQLSLKGDARLHTSVLPSGKLRMSGVYYVGDGTYDLTYQQILRRKFTIDKGSTITWAGDPYRPQFGIRARYEVKAPPLGLVETLVTDATSLEAYRQPLPFNVLLKIDGNFSRLNIGFDIQVKESDEPVSKEVLSNVNAQLSQFRSDTSVMTKQAFALLLLNQFISNRGQNMFATVRPANAVLGSVSQLLAEELNLLAAGVLKRANISLKVNPYASYLSTSDKLLAGVNVALTKKMIQDRLEISLAKNFDLSGYASSSSQMLDNINASYKLTNDGRFRIKVYRKNAQQVMLEGLVVETGVSFIITMDYQRFRELFRSSKSQ